MLQDIAYKHIWFNIKAVEAAGNRVRADAGKRQHINILKTYIKVTTAFIYCPGSAPNYIQLRQVRMKVVPRRIKYRFHYTRKENPWEKPTKYILL